MSKPFVIGDIVVWKGKVSVVNGFDGKGGYEIETYKLDLGPECRAWEGANGIPVTVGDVDGSELRIASEAERTDFAVLTAALVALYNDLESNKSMIERLKEKQRSILGAVKELSRDFPHLNIKDKENLLSVS